ncbi:hypothetical protein [Yersinia massiliensis]|uniref:hypothetical protein n=1 Tax=Yersinia massiliensis TaxID=419257 RepID=UPI001558089B|nr:hypothetical protein [Yersinia massiliensis]
MTWNDASTFCTNKELQQPTRLQLTNVESGTGTRQAGSQALWSEWSSMMNSYPGSGFVSSGIDSGGVVCRQGL